MFMWYGLLLYVLKGVLIFLFSGMTFNILQPGLSRDPAKDSALVWHRALAAKCPFGLR